MCRLVRASAFAARSVHDASELLILAAWRHAELSSQTCFDDPEVCKSVQVFGAEDSDHTIWNMDGRQGVLTSSSKRCLEPPVACSERLCVPNKLGRGPLAGPGAEPVSKRPDSVPALELFRVLDRGLRTSKFRRLNHS